ncbi:protein SPMIP2 [Carettochelys insculpta]|uniref:protein SPMIP2 n=1 Tax=Carettochelys insculpta TaxID=44489 RepID=UPI003EBDAFAB
MGQRLLAPESLDEPADFPQALPVAHRYPAAPGHPYVECPYGRETIWHHCLEAGHSRWLPIHRIAAWCGQDHRQGCRHAGPDAIRDYRTKLPEYTRYIGATTPAQGATGDLEYMWRTAPWTTSILPHKCYCPGQIGWGVREFSYLNRGNLLSGMQIKTGELRQAAEDEITHRYQNPWQPPPHILDLQGCNTRGRLAWNCNDYNNFYQANSKWAAMTRDNWSSTPYALPKLKVQYFL